MRRHLSAFLLGGLAAAAAFGAFRPSAVKDDPCTFTVWIEETRTIRVPVLVQAKDKDSAALIVMQGGGLRDFTRSRCLAEDVTIPLVQEGDQTAFCP